MRDEKQRLAMLRQYQVLDTATEKIYDDLTKLAATICNVPISLVSLIDSGRQWFKSHHGLTAEETPRDQAFCAHAILQNDILVVEDAAYDDRFRNNPLVTNDPSIRFYAGAPLTVASGANLGTLCVIDRVPRTLAGFQLDALSVLRDAVVAHLELRRTVDEIRVLEGSIPICAWCRSVRLDESGEWLAMDKYLSTLSSVTHGMCPSCATEIKATLR